jgi:hypothetical protein
MIYKGCIRIGEVRFEKGLLLLDIDKIMFA